MGWSLEELARIRRELDGLLAARSAATCAAFRGEESDLRGVYRAHPAAWHAEAPRIVEEAIARAGDPLGRAALERLRRAVWRERVRAEVAHLEDRIAEAEREAIAWGPGGPLPLRAARRAAVLDDQRARRARLWEAIARAEAAQEALRSDAIALQREALARAGLSAPALVPLDPEALAGEAERALAASEDAWRDLLPRALADVGDAADHDLAALAAATAAGEAFPAGGLALTVRRLVAQMGFDARAGAVRLDLERRPMAAIGACVEKGAGRARVSLAPLGTPADWPALLGAVAVGLRHVSVAPAAPVEDRRCGDPANEAAFAAIFAGVVRAPAFYRRVVDATRRAAERARLLFVTLALLELRSCCAGALFELDLWVGGPSRAAARRFAERFAAATAARWDERRWAVHADLALPAANRLRGLARAGGILPALRERCDEDWWRNPRTGPLLQEAWARGAAAEPPAFAGPASLKAWLGELLAAI